MTIPAANFTRVQWFQHLFPEGVPQLWCPPLTHYGPDGAIDAARIAAHLRFISPWAGGLLVPGSTGDGWELTSSQTQELLDVVLRIIQPLKLRLLIGALRPDATEARQLISETVSRLNLNTGTPPASGFAERAVCGFAICPPRGAGLGQSEIEGGLCRTLDLGFPTALYQLPQMTQNEMSPSLLAGLANRYPNFILFKDTSGRDAAAMSDQDFQGVFLVRGMEGGFAQWLRTADGPYDGFLLSSANYFARHLHTLIELLQAGRRVEAGTLSQRLTDAILQMFALVKDLPTGNAFSNAGKAFDHFFAYGPQAAMLPPPLVHSGQPLPGEMIRAAGELLTQYQLMPDRGYLE